MRSGEESAGLPTACVCCGVCWRLPLRPSPGTSRSSWTSVPEARLARAAPCSASVRGLGETWRTSPPSRLPPRTHALSRDEPLTRVPAGCAACEGSRARSPRRPRPAAAPGTSVAQSGDLPLALTYIGKEKGTKNTRNRPSETPALPGGPAAGRAAPGSSVAGDERTQELQDAARLLAEGPEPPGTRIRGAGRGSLLRQGTAGLRPLGRASPGRPSPAKPVCPAS